MNPRIGPAHETDIPQLLSLNNRYAASGLTLARAPEFAANHLPDYRVLRDAQGGILGCVALDEYSPSVVELISLAVDEDAHGNGYGRQHAGELSHLGGTDFGPAVRDYAV